MYSASTSFPRHRSVIIDRFERTILDVFVVSVCSLFILAKSPLGRRWKVR
jgi:hypothetical protein